MGFVFDQFQTLLQVNRFAARGLFITCLTYHLVFVSASNVLNAKKIGMLKIENYKKKIKYGNKQKTMTKIKNGKRPGGKDKEEKSKYM